MHGLDGVFLVAFEIGCKWDCWGTRCELRFMEFTFSVKDNVSIAYVFREIIKKRH
jgi:hypothetical protein